MTRCGTIKGSGLIRLVVIADTVVVVEATEEDSGGEGGEGKGAADGGVVDAAILGTAEVYGG